MKFQESFLYMIIRDDIVIGRLFLYLLCEHLNLYAISFSMNSFGVRLYKEEC